MKYEDASFIAKYRRRAPSIFFILVAIFSIIRNGTANLNLMFHDLFYILALGLLFSVCFFIFYFLRLAYLKLTHRNQHGQDALARIMFFYFFWGWFCIESATHNKTDIMASSLFFITVGTCLISWRVWQVLHVSQEKELKA